MRDMAAAQWAICAFPAIGALMAVWLACLLRERGIRPLRRLARPLRRPRWETLAALVCVGGLVHHGATKHVASSPYGPGAAVASLDTPLSAQSGAESPETSPDRTNAVCGVCATGILPGETSILIRAQWPTPPAGGASGVEVYARPRLDVGGWSGVGTAAIPSGTDGMAIEIPHSILPDGRSEAMFFTLGLDADADGDGLTNGEENDWGTRPNLPDTDGDGVSDGAEALGASDPLDASDGGSLGSCRLVRLEFGDPSGSRSEKYVLSVASVAVTGTGAMPRSHVFLNREYGECETKAVALKPGWRYEVMLYWAACKTTEKGYPDYDYRLLLADANLTSGVFLDDPEGLFAANDDTSTTFAGENKAAYLDVVNLKIISDRQMPYDECREGALIDCRTATVSVEPCVAGSTLANRSFDLVCTPVENGALVNDNRGTAVTAKKIGLNIWRTSTIYWYGVLPDRDCSKYHREYSFDLRENGKTVISRKCPVGWPESNAFSTVLPPSENDTHRSEAKFYHSKSEDYWYCEIIFESFKFEQGFIRTEPDGVNFTWTGQYADKIRAEEEFHIKQVKGEVPTSQGGQGDCYTLKGLKHFISQQAISNQNVVTSTWIVKGKTRQEAEDNADEVIANAVKQELVESLRIRFADRGFMEYAVKRHLNYNAAFRCHCSYEETYGSNPINHVHPAYINEGE